MYVTYDYLQFSTAKALLFNIGNNRSHRNIPVNSQNLITIIEINRHLVTDMVLFDLFYHLICTGSAGEVRFKNENHQQ